MSMVKLADGSQVSLQAFITIQMNIKNVAIENPFILMELMNKCKDVGYRFIKYSSFDSAKILKEHFLLIGDNETVHDDVRRIVLNCLKPTVSEKGISITFKHQVTTESKIK